MKIALIGNGTVSKGVQQIMDTEDIRYIYVRNEAKCLNERYTCHYEDILNSDVDTVVELINNDEAYPFITKALMAGKHVVTANKLTLSLHLKEYSELAEEMGVELRYSASAGGGIPIIHNLNRDHRIDKISRVAGIMNGTTNYILYHMEKDGMDFKVALKNAQELGFAEADPTSDIEGYDAARKLMILTSIACDGIADVEKIECCGISHITAKDIEYFKEKGLKIRLIAQMDHKNDHYYGSVMPTILDDTMIESMVTECNNCISLYGETIGKLSLYGQGAGCLPTANAVVSDVYDIAQGNHFYTDFNKKLVFDDELVKTSYVVRSNDTEIKKYLADVTDRCDGEYLYTCALCPKTFNDLVRTIKERDPEAFIARIG